MTVGALEHCRVERHTRAHVPHRGGNAVALEDGGCFFRRAHHLADGQDAGSLCWILPQLQRVQPSGQLLVLHGARNALRVTNDDWTGVGE